MKILFVLTYYHPHISGLSVYVKRLAEAMSKCGHQCTVLTSQFEKDLPKEEIIQGVRVIRIPIVKKISKGVLMPGFMKAFIDEAKNHDIVSAHLPQFEAGILAFANKYIVKKKTVFTYHCDLQLPPGLFNRLVDFIVHFNNWLGGKFTDKIVAYTQDYADHSFFLRQFPQKVVVIPPPVIMPSPKKEAVQEFKKKHDLEEFSLIGMATRMAFEKGIGVILDALPPIIANNSKIKLVIVGQYKDVLGENVYNVLKPQFDAFKENIMLLGVIPEEELPMFYASLDVLTIPSINMTESFGLVQVEAMLQGTPVVASNLPGVRVPVQTTGMGMIAKIGDAKDLADKITTVLNNRSQYTQPRLKVEQDFSLEKTVAEYQNLFSSLLGKS